MRGITGGVLNGNKRAFNLKLLKTRVQVYIDE